MGSSSHRSARQVVRTLALWAQRRSYRIPAPARRFAGGAVRRVAAGRDGGNGPLEDWSVPLIGDRSTGNVESLVAAPYARPGSEERRPTVTEVAETTRLRCAIATRELDVGGAEEFAAFLARGLPSLGIDTVVVHTALKPGGQPGEAGRVARTLAAEGVATMELSPGTSAEWFSSFRPDVVSAHYAPDWMLEAATDQGIPWVETLHGMHSFFHPDSWERERVRAERITAQIAVSDLVRRQYLVRNPAFPAGRVVTVPNGVDRDRLTDVDRAAARRSLGLANEFLFLSLARYCLQKNTFGLVSAFAEVATRHPEAHLLVAGRADDPTYFEQTRQQARTLAAADRIHLRGHCSNPSALLAAADAFVMDSFFEGWSLASMQALAAGLPVVLSDVGGAREQVGENGACGHLIPNPGGDPELVDWRVISDQRFRPQGNRVEAVAAMSALVRDRDAWAGRREQLREGTTRRFSADDCLRGHAAVLRRVALGRSPADLPPETADVSAGPTRRP